MCSSVNPEISIRFFFLDDMTQKRPLKVCGDISQRWMTKDVSLQSHFNTVYVCLFLRVCVIMCLGVYICVFSSLCASLHPSPLGSACVSLCISMVLTAACLARKRRVVSSAWNLAPPCDYWLLSVSSTLQHHCPDNRPQQHQYFGACLISIRVESGGCVSWRLCFAAVCALPKVGGCSQADFPAGQWVSLRKRAADHPLQTRQQNQEGGYHE